MTNFNIDTVLEQIQYALEQDDLNSAIQILETLRGPDQADVFNELDDEAKIVLLPQLDPSTSADILEDLDDEEAAELVGALPSSHAIPIVKEMEPDEAADLLGDIDDRQAEEILAGLEKPEEVRPLLLHPDDSAGGLMTSDFLVLRRKMTAAEAIEAIRQWKPETEAAYYLFVVDGEEKLVGVVSMRQLIVAEPHTLLVDIMDPQVISVAAGTDQEECARLMKHYDLVALPVVNGNGRLLGVITIDDVIDVLEEEATEDIQRLGGAQPLDQPYLSTRITFVTRKRIGWLLLLFVTESLTGTVLRHFQGELESVVALAFFVPLLIGTGGNAGSQTTSTIIRALAVGDIDLGDALRSLWHELRVGLLLGMGMSVIAYLRALTWGSNQGLALTVSLAIFTIIIWSNALGALLPILAARLKIDPTVVSGPVMSTLVDATGLFIYFTVAHIIMGI
ncbi:MAG TPA: magnesium transporter [Anaerolineales bacterium]|jgi:magnesium transporter|nr:magnesium transporter [Anaerolineales bacterium]